MPDDLPDLIGTAEAAELLGLERSTISYWIKDGRLEPAMKMPGRVGAYLFHRSYIESKRPMADAAKAAKAGRREEVEVA